MPLGLSQSSSLAQATFVNRATCPTATSAAATAGNAKVAVAAVFRQGVASGNLIDSYDFITDAGTVNVASPALRVGFTDGAGQRTELTFWVQLNAPAGITTGRPVLTYDDTSNNAVSHAFGEFEDVAASSAVDQVGSAATAGIVGTTSITVTTSTHTQADSVAIYGFADRWNFSINGNTTDGAAPTSFTRMFGTATNTVMSFLGAFRVLTSTAGLSVVTTISDQVDNGQLAGLVILRGTTASLRVEVEGFDPAVTTGVTVDDVAVWTGSPFTTTANSHYEDVAFNSDGTIFLAPAPAGTTNGQTVNVLLDDATTSAGAVGIVQGTVRSYTP